MACLLQTSPHPYTCTLLVCFALHFSSGLIFLLVVAFEPVIESQATGRLLEEYGKLVANRGVIGYVLSISIQTIVPVPAGEPSLG